MYRYCSYVRSLNDGFRRVSRLVANSWKVGSLRSGDCAAGGSQMPAWIFQHILELDLRSRLGPAVELGAEVDAMTAAVGPHAQLPRREAVRASVCEDLPGSSGIGWPATTATGRHRRSTTRRAAFPRRRPNRGTVDRGLEPASERTLKAAFTPGSTFAGYRIESLVGRGGMGVVYRATDLSLERPVALKLIAPELAEDQRFRERFLREPRLAASLDHPNVIPIYEAGEHDGQLYLAMRFVEGSDLKSVLEREGKLASERALAILAQVAGALDAAHRRALVHRDVKPANVLLDEEGHVYLTDFGITKQLGGASTDTGRLVGTLDYLAPEQIRGDPVDGRTDVYALGCVLYECLSGTPPFRRASEAETMWAHMRDQPAALRGRGRLLVAGGLLLLAVVVAAVLATGGTDEGSQAEPLGNGVAAIDPAD